MQIVTPRQKQVSAMAGPEAGMRAGRTRSPSPRSSGFLPRASCLPTWRTARCQHRLKQQAALMKHDIVELRRRGLKPIRPARQIGVSHSGPGCGRQSLQCKDGRSRSEVAAPRRYRGTPVQCRLCTLNPADPWRLRYRACGRKSPIHCHTRPGRAPSGAQGPGSGQGEGCSTGCRG